MNQIELQSQEKINLKAYLNQWWQNYLHNRPKLCDKRFLSFCKAPPFFSRIVTPEIETKFHKLVLTQLPVSSTNHARFNSVNPHKLHVQFAALNCRLSDEMRQLRDIKCAIVNQILCILLLLFIFNMKLILSHSCCSQQLGKQIHFIQCCLINSRAFFALFCVVC